MREEIKKLLRRCQGCESGSCCQEGAELNKEEIRKILKFNPPIKKPWFRLADPEYEPEPDYPYETRLKNGRCIFQDKDKRCLIYEVRPKKCAEFPLENGKLAEYYKRLCNNRRL